jgi:sterol carrier protein 2
MFGNASLEYMRKNGVEAGDFAEVARANHEHSQQNPYSQFHDVYTLDQVRESPEISCPLTKLQCCPTSDGSAAAVVVSQAFLDARPYLKAQAVQILGQATTDSPSLYSGSMLNLVGYEISRHTARAALAEAGVAIASVDVIELHDCFSANEIFTIDALGLTPPGQVHQYIRAGQHTYGSKAAVINPSGGLISKGHPLGATGIAQCAELVWQLRGWANNRLVPVPASHVALQHNAGLGGAAVVTILHRADRSSNSEISSAEVAELTGLGYNPAFEARGFTAAQADRVRSRQRSDWALGDTANEIQSRF